MPTPYLQPGLPTICRDVNRLLLAVEQCVRNFSRYHKYQMARLGLVQDLRLQLKPQMWVDKAHRGDTFIPFLQGERRYEKYNHMLAAVFARPKWRG